jgi:predicted permease
MRRLRALLSRVSGLFGGTAREREIADELDSHLQMHIEDNLRAGMTAEQARRGAVLRLGGVERTKQAYRERSTLPQMENVLQDLRFAVRQLRKHPGFTVTAVLTLALGIGASTAVFSLVNMILLKPSPYPNANRVVVPWRVPPTGSAWEIGNFPWSDAEFVQLTQTNTVFQKVGAFRKDNFNLTGSANPEYLEGVRASAGFFPALGMAPMLGRTFTAEEDQPGHALVAVLSHRLWKSRFGGDPGVVGRVIDLSGLPYTVIGVMPADFTFPNMAGMPASIDLPKETQLWVPLALPAAPIPASSDLSVVGELKPNIGLVQAQQDLQAFDRSWLEKYPRSKGWSSDVVPLTKQAVTDTRRPLLLLFGAVCVVLLIACSNVAGLALNRSLERYKEFTLRGALGARRGRLVGQLMTESLLLALSGGVLGILLAEGSLVVAKRLGPESIPHLHEIGLDLNVFAFALGITFVSGILFGLVPAFGATRMNLVEALKEGGQRSGGSASAPRIRNVLLISQVALALVLVVSASLLVRTFYHMVNANSGFDATHVVTFEVPLPTTKYSDTDRMARVYQQVAQRVQSIAGVQSAGFATVVPLAGPSDATEIRMPEHPVTDTAQSPKANYLFVSPGYFATIGAPFRGGRDIADGDVLTTMPVTIINSAMAKKFWPGENPIGKQVGVGMKRIPARTIVGVVADIKQVSLREAPDPTMYVPYTQNEIKTWPNMQAMQYAIRTKADPDSIAGSIREAVHSVDPDLPVANFAPLTALVDTSLTADRFAMLLLGGFGILALMLSAIGMYGVISYSVMQRTPEIGIRIALGARRAQILVMILGQACRLACAGIAIGLIAALTTTRLMTRFLYGVQPTDPTTFAAVSLLLMAVVLLACYVPARKAMKVDPMIALRAE